MKLKFLFAFVYLLMGTTAFAELSTIATQWITIGTAQCDAVNNELIYKEYWKDSVKPENSKAVCIAEQFADQVAASGESWLEGQVDGLVDLCRSQSDSQKSYFSCLKITLDRTAKQISTPCSELGLQEIWDEDKCKRLVSYIFIKKFEMILEQRKKPAEKVKPIFKKIESELSLTSTWRIERAMERCEQSNNDLIYPEFWGDFVKPENRETVCLAEQFAEQMAADGDHWLANKSGKLIEECKKLGKKDEKIYALCLEKNLKQKILKLSRSCKEIGEKKIWSEQSCKLLVSYIFRMKIEKIVKPKMHLLEKIKRSLDRLNENKWVKLLINPVMAVLVFLLFVLDVVFLTEKGNWMQISRTGLIVGPLILLSGFTKTGNRLLSSGLAIVIIIGFIAWNHRKLVKKPKKKKPIPIEF